MPNQEENVRGASMMPKTLIPYILAVFSSVSIAGFIAVAKVALERGMSPYVLVVYGNAIGTLTTALFAFLLEKNNKNKITAIILLYIFFLALFWSVLGRILFYAGLEYTSLTLTGALSNLGPSATFILAFICRLEKVDIFKRGSQAKIGGTIIALAGATLITFYHGPVVISPLNPLSNKIITPKIRRGGDRIKGCLMLIVAIVSITGYYILQTIAIKKYPAPITLISLTCFVGTILSAIMTVILDHKASTWRLSWDISLLAPIYSVSTSVSNSNGNSFQHYGIACLQSEISAAHSKMSQATKYLVKHWKGKSLQKVSNDSIIISNNNLQGKGDACPEDDHI